MPVTVGVYPIKTTWPSVWALMLFWRMLGFHAVSKFTRGVTLKCDSPLLGGADLLSVS